MGTLSIKCTHLNGIVKKSSLANLHRIYMYVGLSKGTENVSPSPLIPVH